MIHGLEGERQRKRLIEWVLENDFSILVAFSGGKDSIAMVLQLLELGVTKERIELWHHDVDGHEEQLFDWPCTRDYCKQFAKTLGLKILFSYREGGIKREILKGKNEKDHLGNWIPEFSGDYYFQLEEDGEFMQKAFNRSRGGKVRGMFPAVSADLRKRWCSGHVKIDVMSSAIRNTPRFKKGEVLICTGERRSESTKRAQYEELEPYRMEKAKFTPKVTRRALLWRCIIDKTDDEVWALMRKHRIQAHPAYMLGMNRCSCMKCIFNSPNTWASLYQIDPAGVSEIARMEQQINHTLYAGMTIMEKIDRGKSFITSDMEFWVQVALSARFTLPVIVEDWQLPKGAKTTESCGAL